VRGRAGDPHARDRLDGDVLERRRRILERLGQRDPELQAVAAVGPIDEVLGVRSEWTMPRPADIQLTAPGSIRWTTPVESRCMIAPSKR